jgi:hypothetical protein
VHETNAEITGNRRYPGMEKAVRHGRIQQRADDPTMEDSIIPLKSPMQQQLSFHDTLSGRFESQPQRQRILVPAEKTLRMEVRREVPGGFFPCIPLPGKRCSRSRAYGQVLLCISNQFFDSH